MGKSLSLDIRERVVALVEEGLSCHEAARRLRISAASAVRIMQRKRRTGEVSAAPQGRPRRSKLDAVSDWLMARVEAVPDITMPELADELALVHEIRATPAMLSRHLIHRLGITYKKIPDRDGEAAQTGPRRAIRVAPSPDAEDAP
jgi:transposase